MNNTSSQKPSRIRQFFTVLSQKRNDAMRAMLLASTPSVLQPTFTVSKLLALLLAIPIHALSLAIAAGGVYMIAVYGRDWWALVPGGFLLALAWFLRPRLGRFPEKQILSEDEAPMLYALAEATAQALDTRKVDGILITGDYNASIGRVGVDQRELLIIGKPLWDVLEGQEHVGLIAHELAHTANGDFNQALFVGSAYNTLAMWHSLLRPSARYWVGSDAPFGCRINPSEALSLIFMQILAMFVRLVAFTLRFLLWHDARRAEYLADYLGSTVSGTQAMRSTIGRLYYGKSLAELMRRNRYASRQSIQREYEGLRERISHVPLDELERINQPTPGEQARLDLDHPPIGYRLEFLKANPVHEAMFDILPEDEEEIQRELEAAIRKRYKRLPSVYDDDFQYKPSRAKDDSE